MSDDQFKNLKLWLDEKFKSIDRRFDENDKGNQRIIRRQDVTNGGQKLNTEFRLKALGGMTMVKILFGTSIVSNIFVVWQFLINR